MAKPLTCSRAAKRAAQKMERQLSNLEGRLAEENERLVELQDRRVSMEAQTEAEQLLEEQRQLHEDLQAELMEAVARGDALEECCCSLENQLTKGWRTLS